MRPGCQPHSTARTPRQGLLTSRRTVRFWMRWADICCSFPDCFRIWTSFLVEVMLRTQILRPCWKTAIGGARLEAAGISPRSFRRQPLGMHR
jgi:hypothetical protein